MSDGSGLTSSESFARWDPDGSCWRTSQGCLLSEGSQVFSGPWPRWGFLAHGEAFRLRPRVPRSRETGGSWWRTPAASDYKRGHKTQELIASLGPKVRVGLMDQTSWWPAPLAIRRADCPAERERHSPSLESASAIWMERFLQDLSTTSPGLVCLLSGQNSRRRHNLGFRRWLMGFPEQWIDFSLGSWCDGIRATGNAVVPAQAALAVRALLGMGGGAR
jgi:hypothetical protein